MDRRDETADDQGDGNRGGDGGSHGPRTRWLPNEVGQAEALRSAGPAPPTKDDGEKHWGEHAGRDREGGRGDAHRRLRRRRLPLLQCAVSLGDPAEAHGGGTDSGH